METSGRVAAVGLIVAFMLIVVGCYDPDTPLPESTQEQPETLESRDDEPLGVSLEAPPVDLSEAAGSKVFQDAINAFEKIVGTEGEPHARINGAVTFKVANQRVAASLERWHGEFFSRGVFLMRMENNFGFGGDPDVIVLLPTTDKYEAIRAAGTNGINYDVTNEDVVAWLRELEQTHPFIITGAGFDFIEGRFLAIPTDVADLAGRMYAFCPDIVDQGVGDISGLAAELKKKTLYFWWD